MQKQAENECVPKKILHPHRYFCHNTVLVGEHVQAALARRVLGMGILSNGAKVPTNSERN